MNQVEQWFGILKRQRLRIVDFADKAALSERIQTFIAQWNERAHPFRWTSKSFDKILAKCQKSEPVSEPLPRRHDFRPPNAGRCTKASLPRRNDRFATADKGTIDNEIGLQNLISDTDSLS